MKTKLSKRIISIVLVLVMMLSIVPLNVFAAQGDIINKGETGFGTTGFQAGTLGNNGVINWPIKVYDYVADGMLFEFNQLQTNGNNDINSRSDMQGGGGQYVFGNPVPYAQLAIDYTTDTPYQLLLNKSGTVETDGRSDYFRKFVTTVDNETIPEKYRNTASATNNERYKVKVVQAVDYVSPQYLHFTKGANYNAGGDMFLCLTDFRSWRTYHGDRTSLYQDIDGKGGYLKKENVKYLTVVYRSSGLSKLENVRTSPIFSGRTHREPIELAAITNGTSKTNATNTTTADGQTWPATDMAHLNDAGTDNRKFVDSNGEWTYAVVDIDALLRNLGPWSSATAVQSVHISFGMDSDSDYFDLAQVGYFTDLDEAKQYGENCLTFIEEPGEFLEEIDGKTLWNPGNNNAFGLRWPSNSIGNPPYHRGGAPRSTYTSGGTTYQNNAGIYASYYTFMPGWQDPAYYVAEYANYNNPRKKGKDAATGRFDGSGTELLGSEAGVYYIDDEWNIKVHNQWPPEDKYAHSKANGEYFDTSQYDFGGYNLLTKFTKGQLTMGLLQSSLNKNGTPEYKPYSVEYLADLLSKTLVIPREAPNELYNYSYVAGVKNGEQYGYDKDGKPLDLAQALRNCLGITFESGTDATTGYAAAPTMGTYSETIAKRDKLIGKFLDCKGNIKTCMDAAYYLFHNLFTDNSYNQTQDDFQYLTLSSATLDNGTEAFIFDGGFSTGDGKSSSETNEAYKARSKNSVNYSAYGLGGNGTISLGEVNGKDMYNYEKSNITTRFPFLPVVNTDESNKISKDIDYPAYRDNQTNSYNFADNFKNSYTEELNTYRNRNYNFTLASNGEFVYNEEDDLFFEFEGDDDVYLFINGELVLDLGSAHKISTCSLNVNDYVKWAREVLAAEEANPDQTTYDDADIARAKKLDLIDGEIASFDFYYMERHGYGSNMRIVTNMQITDPNMRVDKSAYQFGEEVEMSGLVDPDSPIEYNFQLKNTGNQKLFNLTFDDANIGISLDPVKGLLVKGDDTADETDNINGSLIRDYNGGKLDASDLTAVVTGYKPVEDGTGDYLLNADTREYTKVEVGQGTHVYTEIEVTFTDNEQLKNFLKTLQADGLEDGFDFETQVTQQGAGLWVDADVTFKGINYYLTDDQIKAGKFENTVYVTSNNDPNGNGEILRSQDTHRIYIAGVPYYYQWAGHNIYIPTQKILDDSIAASQLDGNRLEEYKAFLTNNRNMSNTRFLLSDKYGKLVEYGDTVQWTNANGKDGYLVNFKESGVNEFYMLMIDSTAAATTTDVSKLTEGQYAIVRLMVYTTQVKDSTFVLDYGLKTEELDTNGELFKNDNLLGAQKKTEAKVIAISNKEAKYLDPKDNATVYNQIDFTPLEDYKQIPVYGKDNKIDGYYTLNLNIPDGGKTIKYNANTDKYSLSDTGTVNIHAVVPVHWGVIDEDEVSDDVNIYYWYSNNVNNGWPGKKMDLGRPGNFSTTIPDDVPYIIINRVVTHTNGIVETTQTTDINLNVGEEAWIEIDDANMQDGKYVPSVDYKNSNTTIHVEAPAEWNEVYLYAWEGTDNEVEAWPGTKMTEKDEDGYYVIDVPGNITKVVVNNGVASNSTTDALHKTEDTPVYAGKENWVAVEDGTPGIDENGNTVYIHAATSSLSTRTVTLHATVPSDWKGANIWYWYSNGADTGLGEWPGPAMTKGANGEYTYEIPSGVTNVIINNGDTNNMRQTEDLTISSGLETWISVTSDDINAKVEATVPSGYGDVYFYFFNSYGDVGPAWPGTKVTASGGKYAMDVPAGATTVIVNNNKGTQTQNLMLTPNVTNAFAISSTGEATIKNTNLYVSVPENWGDVYIGYKGGSAANYTYAKLTEQDVNKRYKFNLSSANNGVIKEYIITNGTNNTTAKHTAAINNFYNGVDNFIDVNDTTDNGNNTFYVYSSFGALKGFSANISYGKDAMKEGLNFTPTDFMDNEYNLWMAITVHETDTDDIPTPLSSDYININKEVQMFKKITVLPANVVYYEDDFAGITYTPGDNEITPIGGGSGSLTQSVEQDREYGNDTTYQTPETPEYSGERVTQVNVKDKNAKPFASFEFTGTGFEIVGRTNALKSGTLKVVVKNVETGDVVNRIVITEFNNSAATDDGKDETITQVPIIRIDDLKFGKYTVELSGIPIYDRTAGKEADGKPPVKDSYIIIDGIRIFQPLANGTTNGSNDHYNPEEDGATFTEIRTLIENEKASALTYNDDSGLTFGTGLQTWVENRNGYLPGVSEEDEDVAEWKSNTVTSVNDYLLAGPNNEVYMKEIDSNLKTALAFYVKETDVAKTDKNGNPVRNLQIAARAIDYGKYMGDSSTGLKAQLQYGCMVDGQFEWRDLATVTSGTEQYYTIPYSNCHYDEAHEAYQVVIRVANDNDSNTVGMISYSSIKYNGLEPVSFIPIEIKDKEGELEEGGSAETGIIVFPPLKDLAMLMASNNARTFDEEGLVFVVKFQNADGVVYKTQEVKYGEDAIAPVNPTKAADEFYTYTFAGWDKDYRNVVCDLVITAEFDAVAIDRDKAAYEEYKGYDVNADKSNSGTNSAKAQDVYNESFSTGFGTNKK